MVLLLWDFFFSCLGFLWVFFVFCLPFFFFPLCDDGVCMSIFLQLVTIVRTIKRVNWDHHLMSDFCGRKALLEVVLSNPLLRAISHWVWSISRGGGSTISLETSTSFWPLLQEEGVFLCLVEIASILVNFYLLFSCRWAPLTRAWLPLLCFPHVVLTHNLRIRSFAFPTGTVAASRFLQPVGVLLDVAGPASGDSATSPVLWYLQKCHALCVQMKLLSLCRNHE